MKKILLTLGLGIVMLGAGQTKTPMTPEQQALKNTMKSMANGLMRIQKAILYNDRVLLLAGVRDLKRVRPGFLTKHGEALKRFMPDNPEFAMSMAKQSEMKIQKYVDMMREDIFSKHDYSRIAAGYTHIMQQCTWCHRQVRRWAWEK
ncbi:hypothetical protein [Hydrogenimonas sp. SS33]|uniref:hypothetical protein n=1 Tax=Hydrogenimonas leucolamina TaxID=2954236 RepID=UPI00336BD4C0